MTKYSIMDIQTPPNDYEVERSFISCMMTDNDILSLSMMKKERLYYSDHQKIFTAMLDLQKDRKAIDPLVISSIT